MDFLEAVRALREGKCVGITRPGWGEDKLVIENGYIKLANKDGTYRLHFADDEILATDWELVPKPKVKKKIEGWVNLYRHSNHSWTNTLIHPDKITALVWRKGFPETNFLGDPLFIEHEYEADE